MTKGDSFLGRREAFCHHPPTAEEAGDGGLSLCVAGAVDAEVSCHEVREEEVIGFVVGDVVAAAVPGVCVCACVWIGGFEFLWNLEAGALEKFAGLLGGFWG